jgi:hypothetical protein
VALQLQHVLLVGLLKLLLKALAVLGLADQLLKLLLHLQRLVQVDS